MCKLKRLAIVFAVTLIGFCFPIQASSEDASWVKAKWHGEGGVIYLTEKGYLLRSWKGGYYFPMQ